MTTVLIVGWGAFVTVGILCFLSCSLRKGNNQSLTSTNRNVIYLIIFTIANLVWGSFVWLSASKEYELRVGLDDFLFVLCIILPGIAFGIFMTRVAERKRLRILEKQMSNKKDMSE